VRRDTIDEVGIDGEERLHVRPSSVSFEHIYRAALEVNWDAERRRLYSPKPREWSYLRWFEQIVAAAADEYRVQLKVRQDTIWSDVPDELRAAISSAGR
jgi:hypothetical protein